MPELNFQLHDKQLAVFKSKARFKVCAAGRRGGKSYLSAVMLLIEALKSTNSDGKDLKKAEVFYIAPTFNQGKDIMWTTLMDMGQGVIESVRQNEGIIRLVNGRTIKIKGSDRPETLRGVGLSFVVMDEYADMKPEVWDLIVRPALSDYIGGALFIGTPSGKNHFYELWTRAGKFQEMGHPEWASFHFNSLDNPHLKPTEIDAARGSMSAAAFRQEYEASFTAGSGGTFKEEYLRYAEEPKERGEIYIAWDLAGYGTNEGLIQSAIKRRDEHAGAVVEVSTEGWFVHEIIHGRWDVRETALRIVKAARDYGPVAGVGIEKGMAYNAVLPYLEDEMKRMNRFFTVQPLSHGGKNKNERITWALQGRAERGRLVLNKNQDWKHFIDQFLDFPNPMAHDDLLDALSYVDQMATVSYHTSYIQEEYEPLDAWTGI